MSILLICNIAFMALVDFPASLPCSSSLKIEGMICHDRPDLSVSQPHLFFSPPAESLSQRSSTSSCVWQFTKKDIAGVKVNRGPPLSAKKACPSSSNVTDMTDPFGPGPASPYRPTLMI